MSAPLSVSARGRDLTIELNDSCNCCCFQWRRGPNPRTQVYVNSLGEVVKFDPKKADDEYEALRRCVSNLQTIIGEMAEARAKDKQEVLAQIDRRVIELREDAPRPITVEMIQQMLALVERR